MAGFVRFLPASLIRGSLIRAVVVILGDAIFQTEGEKRGRLPDTQVRPTLTINPSDCYIVPPAACRVSGTARTTLAFISTVVTCITASSERITPS
jgi:hypothetical protein